MSDLLNIYNNLKKEEVNTADNPVQQEPIPVTPELTRSSEQFSDERIEAICRRIIMDIYGKTLPLDKSYKDNNSDRLGKEVDVFLGKGQTTAFEFLRNAYEKSQNPGLEYIQSVLSEYSKSIQEARLQELTRGFSEKEVIDLEDEALQEIIKSDDIAALNQYLEDKIKTQVVDDIAELTKVGEKNKKFRIEQNMVEHFMLINQPALFESGMTNVDPELVTAVAVKETTFYHISKFFKHDIALEASKDLKFHFTV